jgi:hypothetical protein
MLTDGSYRNAEKGSYQGTPSGVPDAVPLDAPSGAAGQSARLKSLRKNHEFGSDVEARRFQRRVKLLESVRASPRRSHC